ncbi:MAG: HAD family hydrolase [Thermodesulfobacteriota bacterium]
MTPAGLASNAPEQTVPAAGPAAPQLVLIRQRIAVASAVSFDFFDTLFVRALLEPEDLFAMIGKRFSIPDFPARRRAAQTEAFRRMQEEGRREITLAGIYACFGPLPLPAEEVMAAEYEMELAVAHPNAELVDLFAATVAAGKPVVLTSDMYLPGRFFIEALERHGLPKVPVFASSDRNATKRDAGELFDLVVASLGVPHGQLLHIGDNPDSDVRMAAAKGLATCGYREARRPESPRTVAPETSLARALLRKHSHQIPPGSFEELGFLHGGPAAVGFLDWLSEQAQRDRIDHLLFLARDGYILNGIARAHPGRPLPRFAYFLGSRVAFTLAAMHEGNFGDFMPFLLSGAEGLSPYELLERIGVQPPAATVMESFGLGDGVRVGPDRLGRLSAFLHAYRWEILKVCRRNRRALHLALNRLGIQPGERVGLVDIGWNGTTQDAFEQAIADLLPLEVFGYYLCLANTTECVRRQRRRRMAALVSSASFSAAILDRLYRNRAAAELFFSAPHPSVVGLAIGQDGEVTMADGSCGARQDQLARISSEIAAGMLLFASSYDAMRKALHLPTSPLQLATPLLEFVCDDGWRDNPLLASVMNFDCWSRTRNRDTPLVGQY